MRLLRCRPISLLHLALCFAILVPHLLSAQLEPAAQLQDTQPNRIAASPDLSTRLTLSGHVPAWATPAADRGSIPDHQQLFLTITLSRSPQLQAAFDQLLADQQNPSSPRYHHWLTPQQIGDQFGPTPTDIAAVSTWLNGQGLTVGDLTPARTQLHVSAPAATVSAAFQTSLHNFARGSRLLQSATAEPTIPAGLAPVVAFISGLSQGRMHTNLRSTGPIPIAQTNIRPAGTHPDVRVGTGPQSANWILPSDFSVLYDLPNFTTTQIGLNQKIMVLGGSRLAPGDVTNYETLAGLPTYQPNYIVPTSTTRPTEFSDPGTTSDGDQAEGMLDFERAFGTAPAATIDQVITTNWLMDSVNQDLVLYAINTVNDPVLTMSFGECEADQTAAFLQNQSSIFDQAAMQGISVFASSGDSGVAGCESQGQAPPPTQVAAVSFPCSFPSVTCVGGTQFSDTANTSAYWSATNRTDGESAISYIPEGAWNEPTGDTTTPFLVAATGGGVSSTFSQPSWQVGTGVPTDGFRHVPDISFSASTHNAYLVCLAYDTADCSTQVDGFGGTSASAPSMAGVAAYLDQRIGTRQGNLNPLLYKLATSTPAAFHDATPATSGVAICSTATASTCNNSNPSATALTGGIAGFPLTTGFDQATGLGSLDVTAFITAAATALAPAATTDTLTASPSTITSAQTALFTASITSTTTGTPTGTVQFSSNGINLGSAVGLAADGTVTFGPTSFNAAGTYTIVAAYSGDSVYAASSASLAFVVTAPTLPLTTTTVSGGPASVSTQQTVSYTATITSTSSGTPSGTVQFVRTSGGVATPIGGPQTLSAGHATLAPTLLPAGSYSIAATYSGDSSFTGSTSSATPLTVTAVQTTTSIPAAAQNITSTQAVTFTATVAPSSANQAVPTGTVQFTVDGQNRGTPVALSGTSAVSSGLTFTAGTHTIAAVYSGDATFASSTSNAATVTATLTPTTTAFTPAPPATLSSTATTTLTATVSGLSAAVSTSAGVIFTDGTTVLGTYSPTSSGTTIVATLTVGPLAAGTHNLTAMFAGDTTYAASTSPIATITVTGPGTITLTPAMTTLTLAAGTPATDTINVVSAGFTGTQTLTCAVNFNGPGTATDTPTCSFSPSTVTFTAGGAATIPATLTVSSVAASAVPGGPQSYNQPSNRSLIPIAGASLASLLVLTLPRRTRRLLKATRLLAGTILLAAIFSTLSGCGGGGSSSGTATPPTNPGTTKGSYDITINANSAFNQPENVGFSGTIALTIQ